MNCSHFNSFDNVEFNSYSIGYCNARYAQLFHGIYEIGHLFLLFSACVKKHFKKYLLA